MAEKPFHVDTLLAHAGGGVDPATGAVVPPISPATTFVRDKDYSLTSDKHLYSRDDNDLYRQIESLATTLENAADTRLFSSGMAAIAAVIRAVKPGRSIVIQSHIYWGTTAWLRKHCAHAGIALIEADASDPENFCEVVRETGPDLVFIEVPANPALQIADIAKTAETCRETGATLAVDATAATPLLLKPLNLGADLAIHSATKALNGHSDALGGLVSTRDADSETWTFIRQERHDAGAVMGPFEAYLLLRGMRTLALRLERMCANAMTIATHLENHPSVEKVLYPGLPSHVGHDLAMKQMTGGFGYLVSVLVKGGAEEALKVAGNLELIKRATSLGGVESLVEHRYTIEGEATGVAKNLLRFSIGIERAEDLLADLDRALTLKRGG
ncbi:aminotransferase class V-fold PLP-dependent enzyme [Rhizobiales bacterium]|uniref:trans-sulfuration enzyme family protein n=1 Tax=Hongsoonwoonella zoysiae TaxID=2821844 RepID=UPI00156034D0|nr:PLP-dependent transferase [Hongsoonwoonella zoysiae]NRG18339.1 aminotransferase class V-fold PLP-dependent enzyme [Hongsoonwoonella zoysiae]